MVMLDERSVHIDSCVPGEVNKCMCIGTYLNHNYLNIITIQVNFLLFYLLLSIKRQKEQSPPV